MTDVDRMTDLTDDELRLRAELARTLVPPPTPASLQLAVDAMAAEHLAAPAGARRSWKAALGMGARGFRLAAGAVAVMVVAGVLGLVLLQARGEQDRVAAPPIPTLPAITQPALPSPAAVPTRLTWAEWIDADTVLAMLRDRPTFRISADGGQTWGQEQALPEPGTDLGFGFTDATHGYSMWMEGAQGAEQVLRVDLTDDGGRTWRKVHAGSLPAAVGADALGNVHFSDERHGVALGTLRATASSGTGFGAPVTCLGWSTADAGTTWTPVSGAPCLWAGGAWPTPSFGYLVAGRETWTTTDGGLSWGHGTLPDPGAGTEIWTRTGVVTSTGALQIIGGTLRTEGDAAPPLLAWQSDDGGATWREEMRNPGVRMTDMGSITAFDGDHWLATASDSHAEWGGSILLETLDGGRSWTEMGRMDIDTGGAVLWADRLHGTIQGVRMPVGGGQGYITAWLTNDGGATWHEVPF